MRDRSSSFVMSAIVVGTYVCALYGAFGTPVKALPPVPARQAVSTPATKPAARATAQPAMATIEDLANR